MQPFYSVALIVSGSALLGFIIGVAGTFRLCEKYFAEAGEQYEALKKDRDRMAETGNAGRNFKRHEAEA